MGDIALIKLLIIQLFNNANRLWFSVLFLPNKDEPALSNSEFLETRAEVLDEDRAFHVTPSLNI